MTCPAPKQGCPCLPGLPFLPTLPALPPKPGQLDVQELPKPPFQSQLDVQGPPKPPSQGQLDAQGPLKPLLQGQLDFPSFVIAWRGAKLAPMLLCSWLPLPLSCMEGAKTCSILTLLLSCSTSLSIYRQEHASIYIYYISITKLADVAWEAGSSWNELGEGARLGRPGWLDRRAWRPTWASRGHARPAWRPTWATWLARSAQIEWL